MKNISGVKLLDDESVSNIEMYFYKRLAAAILVRAVLDYKGLILYTQNKNKRKAIMEEVEDWFRHSEQFRLICAVIGYDPNYILSIIDTIKITDLRKLQKIYI